MKSRPWAKYVAVLLMVALVVPGVLLMASGIEERRNRDAALEDERDKACAGMTTRLREALDTFTAKFEGVSVLGAEEVPPLPSMEQLRSEAQGFEEQVVAGGCSAEEAADALEEWREGNPEVGTLAGAVRSALAANVLDVLEGGTAPPRVTLQDGEDFAAAVSRLPAGATLVVPEGRFETDHTVVVVQDLTIEGAGGALSTVTSAAAEAAVVLASPVALRLSGLGLRHTRGGTASLLVLRAGNARIEDTHLSGATLDSEVSGTTDSSLLSGGSGVVLAGARGLELVDSVAEGNDVAGVVVAGPTSPNLSRVTLRDNGVCGVCFVGRAGGTLRDSRLTGNGAGVMMGDRAAPLLEGNRVAGNVQAGMVLERRTHPEIRDNVVRDNGRFGIALYGTSAARLVDNTVGGHAEAGVVLDVDARARPVVNDNRFTGNPNASLVFLGQSAGLASGNSCAGSSFDLVLDASASPVLRDNDCRVQDQRG